MDRDFLDLNRVGAVIEINLPVSFIIALNDLSKATGRPPSSFIEEAIADLYKRYTQQPPIDLTIEEEEQPSLFE